jgi:hypothetical protein
MAQHDGDDAAADRRGAEQRQGDEDRAALAGHRAKGWRAPGDATRTEQAAATRDIDNDCRQRRHAGRFKSGRFAPKMTRAAGAAIPRRPDAPPRAMPSNIENITP